MTATPTSLFMVDEGEFFNTGQTQYGPLSIAPGFVLTKLEIRAHICFRAATIDHLTPNIQATHMFGVQWGFSGYTPYDFNTAAELDGHTWLFGHSIAAVGDFAVVWSPSTADANYLTTAQFEKTMFFQQAPHELTRDFYLSISDQTSGAPAEYRIFGTFRLWYE